MAILKAIWLFLKGIPLWVYLLILLAVAAAVATNKYGDRRFNEGRAEVQAEFDTFKANLEKQKQAARQEAERIERELADKDEDVLREMREKNRETIAERDRIIADIRADNRELRERFKHQAGTGVPTGASGSTGDNGTRECGLRREDEEFLISEAARADSVVNKLTACQAKLQSIQDSQNGR